MATPPTSDAFDEICAQAEGPRRSSHSPLVRRHNGPTNSPPRRARHRHHGSISVDQLIAAIELNNVKEVDAIIEKGIDLNQVTSNNRFPLMAAVQEGHEEVLEHLLAAKVDLEQRDPVLLQTALHVAAVRNSQACKRLVAAGADVNAKDKMGATPLHTAVDMCKLESIEVLMAGGADLGATNEDGQTPLHRVVALGKLAPLQLLLPRMTTEQRSKTDKDGASAISLAHAKGQSELAQEFDNLCQALAETAVVEEAMEKEASDEEEAASQAFTSALEAK